MPEMLILTPAPDMTAHDDDLEACQALYADLLGAEGWAVRFQPWTEPLPMAARVVMPLLAWGYHLDAASWMQRLRDWPRGVAMVNAAPLIGWNSRKSYLLALADSGVAVVPTILADAVSPADLASAAGAFGCERLVVKPQFSGGAHATHVLAPGSALPPLPDAMMLQPFLDSIATEGEYSLLFFGGAFSHAVVKRPERGDFRVQTQFGGITEPVAASAAMLAVAEGALAALPSPPSYARVDLVRLADGRLAVMEVELIEPYLYLEHAPAAAGPAFARAVAAAAARLCEAGQSV